MTPEGITQWSNIIYDIIFKYVGGLIGLSVIMARGWILIKHMIIMENINQSPEKIVVSSDAAIHVHQIDESEFPSKIVEDDHDSGKGKKNDK